VISGSGVGEKISERMRNEKEEGVFADLIAQVHTY
jgi:hypothetical protein